jgi:hypothetical protein
LPRRLGWLDDLHSREIRVMTAMPKGVRAPALLGSYRSDDWVALIVEDVDGRHPGVARDGADVWPFAGRARRSGLAAGTLEVNRAPA